MKAIIYLLLFFPLSMHGQELLKDSRGEYYRLSIRQAQNLDYWGRKGLACDTLSEKYEQSVVALKAQATIQAIINANLQKAQEEYRGMVKQAAKDNKELTTRLERVTGDLEIYKDKARRRGTTIAIGAAVLVASVIIAIQ